LFRGTVSEKNFNESCVRVLDGNVQRNRSVGIFAKKGGGVNPEV